MKTNTKTAASTNANTCPRCGKDMSLRNGKFGQFMGCTGFPRCNYTQKVGAAPKAAKAPVQIKLLKGSPEQEAIWQVMGTTTDHIVVNALAGCGKTTTIIQSLFRIDLSKVHAAYMCFNASIRKEMEARSPEGVTVVGLHQYGKRALANRFSNHTVDDNKYHNLFQEMFPFTGVEGSKEEAKYWLIAKLVLELVSKCQNFLLAGDAKDLDFLVDHFSIEFDGEIGTDGEVVKATKEDVYPLVPQLMAKGLKKTNVISYNDMLWMPIVLGCQLPTFDLVCVDEAQDLNAVQHALVMAAIAKGQRMMVVGDPNQAIYGFRGSDTESMETLSNLLSMTKRKVSVMPLTESRRCSQAVGREAQKWVPEFRVHPDNAEGMVATSTIDKLLDEKRITKGNMAVCRFNAPIVKLAYSLIAQKIPVHFIGREFGRGILTLAKKFIKGKTLEGMMEKLVAWKEGQLNRLATKSAKGQNMDKEVQAICDKAASVSIFIEEAMAANSEDKSLSLSPVDVLTEIGNFFGLNNGKSDEEHEKGGNDKFRISSVHQAKGLEAQEVIWVNPDATMKVKKAWQLKQEDNLKYVAATRAILNLWKIQISTDK